MTKTTNRFQPLSSGIFEVGPPCDSGGDWYRRGERGPRGAINRDRRCDGGFESQPEAVLGRAGKSPVHDPTTKKQAQTRRACKKSIRAGAVWQGLRIQDLPCRFVVDPDPDPHVQRRIERKLQRENGGPLEPIRGDKGVPRVVDRCTKSATLRGKCKKIVKLLRVDQSLKPVKEVPPVDQFKCGSLRSIVRSMYSLEDLTLVQELSIKTAAKAESQPCDHCESLQSDDRMEQFKKARYLSKSIDAEHLERFSRAFSNNVPNGWNLEAGSFPYVPNGRATLLNGQRAGGNWNQEPFSDKFRLTPVWSSGKIRMVTAYSGHNVEVLTPLHKSLYSRLRRKGWLLVGSPTNERLRYLQAGCRGTNWLSFDYKSATDNIKVAYVQRATEILISKGVGLTDEEIRCLRVFSSFAIDDLGVAECGQPMGSPMSFPVLCLINKTVVDLALTDLLREGKISFKEWTSHRCLINGDDLLTKDVSSAGILAEAIFANGYQVGLESNWEKTLSSPEYAEINSSVFKNCVAQKKTNVSALWMSRDVTCVLGFAQEATVTLKGFLAVATNNATRLARQKIKTCVTLPWSFKESILASKPLKSALCSRPSARAPKDTNLFPVVPVPDGYDLTRGEEVAAISARVREIREKELYSSIPKIKKSNERLRKKISPVPGEKRTRKGLCALLRPKNHDQKDQVLSLLADQWQLKRKEKLAAEEGDVVYHCTPSDLSRVGQALDEIKAFKDKRKWSQAHTLIDPSGCPISQGIGYVSLTDGVK